MFQINFMMYNQRFVQKFKNKLWEVFIDNHQVKQSFAYQINSKIIENAAV